MKNAITRTALRQTIKRMIKPVLSPSVSIRLQRRWVSMMTQVNVMASRVAIENDVITGLPVEILSLKRSEGLSDTLISIADQGLHTLGLGKQKKSHAAAVAAAGRSNRAVIYLHGGAYCIGNARSYRGLTSRLARDSGAEIFVPDYRLAPEFVFPAAQDDVIKLYRWLMDQGYRPEAITFAGDSAGGGLALSSCQRLIREGLPLPSGLILLSPWVDLSLQNAKYLEDSGDVMLSWGWIGRCARFYRGKRSATNPDISPLFGKFEGLPPVYVQAGTDEILLPEIEDLVERMRAAKQEVSLSVFQNMWHVFQMHAGLLEEADLAVAELVSFLHRTAPTPDKNA
ncbi:alpha/beta hydrolase [Allohahella marinimesophila]|uniref:Alpha/beta hydrolase fold-3 domain-containing protein n=1 Tax=Allohahella marinimesophila TaxID=1054972 RepID=A0ABP7Q573_9GAMM